MPSHDEDFSGFEAMAVAVLGMASERLSGSQSVTRTRGAFSYGREGRGTRLPAVDRGCRVSINRTLPPAVEGHHFCWCLPSISHEVQHF